MTDLLMFDVDVKTDGMEEEGRMGGPGWVWGFDIRYMGHKNTISYN